MLMRFLPEEISQLSEPTSRAMAQAIRRVEVLTPLTPQPIATSFLKGGQGGTPIVLLHGFDSSVLEFRRLYPLLATVQETWAIDLLGFGFTERLPQIAYGPEAIKSHLYACWQKFFNRPVILVGASMGGAVALEFSLAYPECVEKVVLIDSVGYAPGPPSIVRYLFPPLDGWAVDFLKSVKVRQRVSELSYNDQNFATSDAALCGMMPVYMPGWKTTNCRFLKSGGYGYLGAIIPKITQPTLILWGALDQILSPAYAQQFKQGIRNSKLVLLDQCGHVPHLEQPKLTCEKILEFLR